MRMEEEEEEEVAMVRNGLLLHDCNDLIFGITDYIVARPVPWQKAKPFYFSALARPMIKQCAR